MTPKVSVIIPTYKSDITLIRAIDSVLDQTYKNIEVLVVDDNNPNDESRLRTENLMKKFVTDPRVIYIKHSYNKNGSAARNTAFANSSGDYIAFLDDDDYYKPLKLYNQVTFLESHRNYGGCYCWREDKGIDVCGTMTGDFSYELLALEFTPYTSAIMIRRECYETLGGFDETYYRHQDFEFLLRFFEKYSLGYVPSVDLVLSTNGINNTPKGKALVQIKEHFFSNFAQTIDRVSLDDPQKKINIVVNHFARTFKDLIRYGYPRLAIYIYKKYGRIYRSAFWNKFIELSTAGVKERIYNIINR